LGKRFAGNRVLTLFGGGQPEEKGVVMKRDMKDIIENFNIEPELYDKFNVKRGLRNADGTGVLVGLTRVGDVHGYIIDEGEKIPVDGKLYYGLCPKILPKTRS